MLLTSSDIAKYFLAKANADTGDLVSNLKLQKLVYYAQGFSLAILDVPLFDEDIEAWMHGPVVPDLYREYKEFGSGAIPTENLDLDRSMFSVEQKDVLDQVYEQYGQFSAWKLREMTHKEAPWKNNYDPYSGRITIPQNEMKEYFKTLVDF